MIRKQLHITKQQKKYFETKSNSTGIKEAELMRRALDQYIYRDND